MPISAILLEQLEKLRPNADLSGSPPRIRPPTERISLSNSGVPMKRSNILAKLTAPGLAPLVLASGISDGRPYFISEYKDMGRLSEKSGQELGKRLALELHQYTSNKGFGFHVPTFCGATRMKNGWYETWEECYSEMIKDLLDALRSTNRVIPKLLGPLDIKPVLLHGDLWSGNTGVDSKTGLPVIFDPSSFYGHSEADLAIARIFGGIPSSFFRAYDEHLPKTDPVEQYELRGDLYELFHYLNHTLVFGGGYASSAERKMDVLLSTEL
ncbi:fructosamine kinase PKL/CAK/FruK [Mucidula mucida]|nr:fructosamine kinase PKL/CAK/FruK [Mucidula mucida]